MTCGSMLPLLQVFRILLYDCPPGLEPVDHRLEPLVRSDVLVLSKNEGPSISIESRPRFCWRTKASTTHPEGLRKVDHHPDGRTRFRYALSLPSLALDPRALCGDIMRMTAPVHRALPQDEYATSTTDRQSSLVVDGIIQYSHH